MGLQTPAQKRGHSHGTKTSRAWAHCVWSPGGPQAGTWVHWASCLQTVSRVQAGTRGPHGCLHSLSRGGGARPLLRRPLTFTKSLLGGEWSSAPFSGRAEPRPEISVTSPVSSTAVRCWRRQSRVPGLHPEGWPGRWAVAGQQKQAGRAQIVGAPLCGFPGHVLLGCPRSAHQPSR